MVSGRLEILTNREDIAVDRSEIPHNLARFVECLPHPYDQAGLCLHSMLLGPRQVAAAYATLSEIL